METDLPWLQTTSRCFPSSTLRKEFHRQQQHGCNGGRCFWEDIDTRLNSKECTNMLTLMDYHVYHWMVGDSKTENVSTPLDVFTISPLESSPVTDKMIQRETRRDPALSQVYSAILSGWNAEQKLRFTQFYQRL